MSLINMTDYPALCFTQRDFKGDTREVVVLAVSFDISEEGLLTPSVEQAPLNFAELCFDDQEQAPLRRESDLAPTKAKVDVVINAQACAPHDTPSKRFPIGFRIRERMPDGAPGKTILDRVLVVTGPRQWRYRMFISRMLRSVFSMCTFFLWRPSPWSLSKPTAVITVPVRYDLAYGGNVRLDEHAKKASKSPLHFSYEQNPLGCGYLPDIKKIKRDTRKGRFFAKRWSNRWARNHRRFPAPQIELPDRPLPSDPRKPYPVVGWGTIPKHWLPRIDLAGTFDAHWEQHRHPLLPEDFNPLYWNGAHPDLQLDQLNTDAIIDLYRVIPASRKADQLLTLRLPGYCFCVEYQDLYLLEPVTADLMLDTLHIDMQENRLTLLYRINLPGLDAPGYIKLSQKETA